MTAPEMAFWSDPQSIGELFVGGGDAMGSEMAALFSVGWHCLLTAGEARLLAAGRMRTFSGARPSTLAVSSRSM